MARILVTGVGGPAGRSTAQMLVERGHEVLGADMRQIALQGVHYRPLPAVKSEDFMSALCSLLREERVDVFIPTVQEELVQVARHQASFGRPVLISPVGATEIANDKYLTARALDRAGVSVPGYCLPTQVGSIAEVTQRIGWPCISKPRVGRGGRDVRINDEADWGYVAALGDGHILQEFAPGTDYAPDVFVGDDGCVVVVTLEKTALRDGRTGNALSVKRAMAPDVAALAAAAVGALGIRGPANVDIRRLADGRPVVLEINARFGASIAQSPEVFDAALNAMMERVCA